MEHKTNDKSLKGISFELWSKEQILKESVVKVTKHERTVVNGKFVNVENSVRDRRMGPLDRLSTCETCGKKTGVCNGHWGHIELTVPIYHVNFYRNVMQWLKGTCRNCASHLFKDTTIPVKKPRVQWMAHFFKSTNLHTTCPNCNIKVPKYTWSKEKFQVMMNKKVYKIQDVLEHLEMISPNILQHFGVSHPKSMILEVLPVPPPTVRPAILMGGTLVRGEDDLTYRLLQILRINRRLKKVIEECRPAHIIQDAALVLQLSVSAYIDHKKATSGKKDFSKEYDSIVARLKSKEGRVRGNLMGKRCDYTARTVITGDDCLSMKEVGVPEDIAKILTVPIKITDWNKNILEDELRKQDGCIQYVINPNGNRFNLKFTNRFSLKLEPGWVVERHLQDGDIVLFNRQPTLHKGSIMAHEVRVMKHRTFRMNLSCTPPYNADFDGDEMNIHVPQTLEAQSEARHIMCVKNNIISAQSNKPVMSIIQDTMIASFLLTQPNVTLSREQFFYCVISMPGWSGKFKFDTNKDYFTGHELVTMCLPLVNYHGGGVKIDCGIMKYGQLTKAVLGTSHGSLIHVINNDCGPEECILFINRMQRVGHLYLNIRGFTMSISDIVTSSENDKFVSEKCKEAFESIQGETNEAKINGVLNGVRDTIGKAVTEPLDQTNNLYCLVHSGTKGKKNNITQIMGPIGQQNLQGKRIPCTWEGRTLTHFKKGENSPQSHGFIESSYRKGLTPSEHFFHAMSGREGVIDTACKTAKSGYMQRKFIKALENCITKSDGSVRNSDGSVIQFQYGDDGFDGTMIEKQSIYEMDEVDENQINPIELYQMKKDIEYLNSINKIREPIYKNTSHWMLPVPVDRIIVNAQTIWSMGIGSTLSQKEIYDTVNTFIHTVENDLLRAFFRIKLNSFKLMKKEVTDEHLEKIIYDINEKLEVSKVLSGETVGSLAAQSVGEYVTQMTLNTFHNTGNSAMNVTLGIPRLTELIDCVKKIQTPISSFYCQNPEIKLKMQLMKLEDLVDYYKITDEPDESEVESFFLFPDSDFKESSLKKTLVLYLREWYDVESVKKCLQTQKNLSIAYTEGPYPIFHVRQIKKEKKKSLNYLYEQVLREKIVRGIDKASVVEVLEEDGRYKVQTSLTDLRQIWALGIAQNAVETNDVNSIYEILGIEAARKKLIDEINNILAFYGLYVNARHILLVVDWMSYTGHLVPLTRHGIKEVDQSVIKKATFEEIINVFNQAAMLNETDDLRGMSERILVGAAPFIGPNADLDVLNDMEVFHKFKKDPPEKVVAEESAWVEHDDENDIYGDMPWINQNGNVNDDPWADERQPWEQQNPFGVVNGMGVMNNMAPISHQTPGLNPPQFHQNSFPQSSLGAQPPPMLTHPFANQPHNLNQQQLVEHSSMSVSLFHQTKPPSPMAQSYDQDGDVPMSPAYDPNVPFEPTSPTYDPDRPPSPTSPAYSPMSPAYSPTSPAYDPNGPFEPTSPTYDPDRPPSPMSPAYSPTSPTYSPSGQSFGAPAYDPTESNSPKRRKTFVE